MNINKDLMFTLSRCAAICEYCADACLHEENVKMLVECIRLDRDCADITRAAMNYVARDSRRAGTVLELCADICSACAEECEKHASKHEHCKECAEICRECEEACKSYEAA